MTTLQVLRFIWHHGTLPEQATIGQMIRLRGLVEHATDRWAVNADGLEMLHRCGMVGCIPDDAA
jgi:hypothetical protein